MQSKDDFSVLNIMAAGTAAFVMISLAIMPDALAAAGEPGHGHGNSSGGHMKMDGGQHGGGHHGKMGSIGEPGKAAEVTRTITVMMKDNFYEPETISVKSGETIRFKVINKGEALHEFGLGTASMHKAHQKEMAVMMEHGMIEVDRINHDRMKMDHGGGGHSMKHDDPNSILLEPGKSGEIIWKFTEKTKLEFACNIPGHYESGMMGPVKFQ
jgi:uncharacterized cupredoxin-like copper-binding protein